MKKFLSLALALMLVLAVACTASAETQKIVWWVYASGDAPIDTQMVVDAANAYSAEKIGVEVELIFKNEEQFGLGMQTGEPYDMTFTCDWANNFADNAINEMFYDITDLVKTATPALYETIDQKYWDVAGSLNGKIYAVPTLKDMASQQFFRLDKERFEAIGCELPEEMTFAELEPLPGAHNDPAMYEAFTASARKVVGAKKVIVLAPSPGAEDFAYYEKEKPGLLFGLGMRNEEKGCCHPAHNKDWDIDEDALETGVKVFVQFVLDNMNGIEGMIIPEGAKENG